MQPRLTTPRLVLRPFGGADAPQVEALTVERAVAHGNRGYCSEAARCVIDFARRPLKLSRIVARCRARNPASARVLDKSGRLREGRLRQHLNQCGSFEDVLLYGVVFPERASAPAST